MNIPGTSDVKRGISGLWESLQCPICLELMTAPVSTKCDHQFCKYCVTKLLDGTKQNKATCPVCKAIVTKRSLQESPGFQRLVVGLQEMIQAYEDDTNTNYLTGMPRQRGQPKVANAEAAVLPCATSSGGMADSECENTDSDDIQKSHSSTVAAQTGFARLMGLEDSSPLITENGLDSGLGGAPPRSDRKMQSPTDDVEAMETGMSEVEEKTTIRRKTRSRERVSKQKASPPLSPDVPEPLVQSSSKKQKKNLDKDKIADQKRKKSLEKVAEWLMKVPPEGSVEAEKPNKDGEEDDSDSSASTIDIRQYARDVNQKKEERAKTLEDQVFGAVYKREQRRGRTSSPPLDVFAHSPETKDAEPGEEKQHVIEDVMDGSSDIFKVAEQMGEEDEASGRGETNREAEFRHPVDEAEPQQTSKRRTMRDRSLQKVDSDLLARAKETTESAEQPKTDKRRGKNTKGRSGKVAKPLVLVAAEDGESSPKTGVRLEDVQLHIENFPSSEEQEASARSSRRSRRLQVFTDVVKQGHKKGKTKTSTLEKNTQPSQDTNTAPPETGNVIKAAERNGCVFNEDLGGIEAMDSPLSRSYVRPTQDAKDAISGAENAALSQANAAFHTPVVPDSTSPAVVELSPESDNPGNCIPNSNQPESQEDKCTGPENDSEMDTEQLLMSFKGAKRKSFHLGGPGLKRRCTDQDNVQSPEAEKSQPVCSSAESAKEKVSETTVRDEAVRDNESLPCSDLISPSISPKLTRKRAGQDSTGGKSLSRNSLSSILTPNKPSRREPESPSPSVVPQVVDSGLCFVAVESEEKKEPCPERNGIPKQTIDAAQHVVSTECSLTPDGLLAPLDVRAVEPCSGDLSVHSSVRGTTGKRAAAQRIGSSSQSSASSKCELPAPADDNDCDVSSQASVDLFGTPDECDLAVNEAVESSQFSSEVLVTQQKIEMQQELVRLEKLMALVSEVLQEKEGSPARDVPSKTNQSGKTTGADAPRPDQDVPLERKTALEAEEDPGAGAPEGTGGSAAQTAKPSVKAATGSELKSPRPAVDQRSDSPSDDKENNTPPPRGGGKAKMVLVTSGLGPSEQIMVKKFAKKLGAHLVSQVTPEVTHVIMQTDEQLVCERTLKYFLGIAGRKWVVSFQWVSESFKQKKLLDESVFEVRGDAVNGADHQGPRRARSTPDNNLLMKGYKICLQGLFSGMSTDDMELMVELCGATVVKDTLSLDSKQKSRQLVIVNPGSESSSSTYSSLSRKAAVVTRAWLLDTVATYTLQDYHNYTV